MLAGGRGAQQAELGRDGGGSMRRAGGWGRPRGCGTCLCIYIYIDIIYISEKP